MIKSTHDASLDFRVFGSYNSVLVDSVAICTCKALASVKTLNLMIYPLHIDDEDMHGLGVAIRPVDTTTTPIRPCNVSLY